MPQTIPVAVLGCGYWGAKHARVCSELPGFYLHSVVDLDAGKAETLEELYPGAAAETDFEGVLENPDIHAVTIATPASSHFALASRALKAGKHALVEKPLAMSPEEAMELTDLAREQELILMVGHTFEYNPAVEVLRRVVQSGELGELYYIDTARLNLGLYQRDVNVIHDLSPHDISILIAILGERPYEVRARGHQMVHGGVMDVAYIEYRFPSGLVANSRVSWLAPRKVREMTVVGSKKMAIYDDASADEAIRIYEKGIDPPLETEQFDQWKFAYHYGPITTIPVPQAEPLKREFQHFLSCIRSGEPPLTDGQSGCNVVAVLHAAQLSARDNGRPHSVFYPDGRSGPVEINEPERRIAVS